MPAPAPPADPATLFGIPAETLTAIGTVGLMVATIVLVIATAALAYAALKQLPLVAGQLRALSEQVEAAHRSDVAARNAEAERARQHAADLAARDKRHLEDSTLRVCERYVSDTVLHGATRRIWDASEGGRNYDRGKVAEHDVITAFNYLDGIAVGVLQGVYSEKIVRDHLESTFVKAVDVMIPKLLDSPQGYEALIELRTRWRTRPTTAYSSAATA